jgi:hypothetical protein
MPVLLRVLEYAAAILLLLTIVTQILIPLIRSKPIFPVFYKKNRK